MSGASGEQQRPWYIIAEHARYMNNVAPVVDKDFFDKVFKTDVGFDWETKYTGQGYNVRDLIGGGSLAPGAGELNPFEGVAAYDPAPALDEVDDQMSEWGIVIEDMDPQELLAIAAEQALLAAEDTAVPAEVIDAAVDAFEARSEEGFQRRLSGSLATMLAGRAVMTDQFDAMAAYMANQRQAEITDYDAKLRLIAHESRTQLAFNFASQFVNLLQLQVSAHQAFAAMHADIAKLRIVAMQDQIEKDLQYDDKEVRWQLDLMDYMNSAIGAAVGAPAYPKESTKTERLVSGIGNVATLGIGVGTAMGSAPAGVAAFGVGALGVLLSTLLG